jgi:hypothetical protein
MALNLALENDVSKQHWRGLEKGVGRGCWTKVEQGTGKQHGKTETGNAIPKQAWKTAI